MDIINNNPYRILGVYANSPMKDIVANEGKAKAFLKVHKAVTFPLDLPQFLPNISRTLGSIADAKSKLTLPDDQIKYAQFWFLKVTPIDDVAFKHLLAGDMDKAIDFWSKQTNASSLQNRITCALIKKEYKTALSLAEYLYHRYSTQFVASITGAGNVVPKNMEYDFLDALCDEIGTNVMRNSVSSSEWKKHISEKAVTPIITHLQSAINAAKATRGKGSKARYDAGVNLMNNTRMSLTQLKELLPTTDLQYQMIADKLGLEILQCGIDYYNGSERKADDAKNAMELQKYALSIVVGQIAKDRCNANVDILNKIIARFPPKEVLVEDKAIKDHLIRFRRKPANISYVISLLNYTKPYLQTIKNKLGVSNSYYLKISTLVVSNALGDVIYAVNVAQNDPGISSKLRLGLPLTDTELEHIKSVLRSAWDATKLMGGFDMESAFRSGRYNPNRSTLKEMCEDFGIPTSISPQPPKKPYTPSQSPQPQTKPYTPPRPPQTPTLGSKGKDDNWKSCGCIVVVIFIVVIIIAVISANNTTDNASSADSIAVDTAIYDPYSILDSAVADTTVVEPDTAFIYPQEDSVTANPYEGNRLKTGAKPYKSVYGKGRTGINYLEFNTSGEYDYVVIAKRHEDDKVVNHIYIRGGENATMNLPNGTYDIYFYSGRSWDPTKDMGKVKGGFTENDHIEKDVAVSLNNEYGQYTLYPVSNGNLTLMNADENEAF